MNELTQNLKQTMSDTFRKIGDETGLRTKGRAYTGNEIADEIDNETEFGISMINSMLKLTIDLVKRDKINVD